MKPINQTLLAIIIALMMLAGFGGVYIAGYEFEQTAVPESLFVSDSNLEFGAADLRAYYVDQGYTFPGLHVPMQYYRNTGTSVFIQQNTTMIYTGNNTWDSAIPALGTGTYANSLVYINPLLPMLKTSMITSITLKMNLPGDADCSVESYIESQKDAVFTATDWAYKTTIQPLTSYNSETSYNETFTLTPYQSLQLYANANANDYTYWAIEIYDTANNGLSGYNFNMSFEFTGTQVTTWSLQDSVNFALGACIAGNIVLIIYMSDAIDLNGYRKDLSNRSGGKKRR